MKKVSESTLLAMGFEDTGMRIGNNEIWQTKSERIIYDPEEEAIVSRYVRECRYLTGKGGTLSVGRRAS